MKVHDEPKLNTDHLSTGFWQLADPKIWIASTVPMFLAAVLAFTAYPERFNVLWFGVGLIAIYLIEIGKNALNEYIDYLTGVDPAVDSAHRTPFSGGKKTIVDGLLSPAQALIIAIWTLGGAALIGLAVVFFHQWQILYFGLAGMGLAVAYSLPPFKLAYRGLGEITVGFVFGPLILNGMYFHLAARLDPLPILLSLPLGFLIANILVINQFPDYEADRGGKKRNWVVRLGKAKAVRLYGVLFLLSNLSILAAAIGMRQAILLIGLLPIPLMIRAVRNAARHHQQIDRLLYSNATTIKIYVLTGLLLIAATVIDNVLLS